MQKYIKSHTLLNNRYRMEEKIGEGGTAVVYRGWDEHLKREVALKRLKGKEDWMVRQFRLEADFVKGLRHPMIPVVYDFFEQEEWYLVTEFVDGVTLREYIGKNGRMEEADACRHAVLLLQCLANLHNRKPPVIYCDLKPDNIMVCRDGTWKLIDWGAAFAMQYGGDSQNILAGTIGYAAPEQLPEKVSGCPGSKNDSAKNRNVDARSDLYAFGRLLYYIVTGADPARPPYGVPPVYAYEPLLSAGLERIIRICTEKDPGRRYSSAEEVIQAVGKRRKSYAWGRKRTFIRKIEKQIWLTGQKEECTFYRDSCIMTE